MKANIFTCFALALLAACSFPVNKQLAETDGKRPSKTNKFLDGKNYYASKEEVAEKAAKVKEKIKQEEIKKAELTKKKDEVTERIIHIETVEAAPAPKVEKEEIANISDVKNEVKAEVVFEYPGSKKSKEPEKTGWTETIEDDEDDINLYNEEGLASWYGPRFHGRKTANGEIFNQNAMTAAHRKLPLGSVVEVTNPDNGKTVIVRINDRGPYSGRRIIDLSKAAAEELEIIGRGVANVKVKQVK